MIGAEGILYVEKAFPDLNDLQKSQYAALFPLYEGWNQKINVISRKDIENLYLHHVLHALGIAKFTSFIGGTKILDVGTGGGFPGIPLAIMFPDVQFTMIDGTAKKLKVVNEIANSIGLGNCTTHHIRAEEFRGKFDFVVSRAVTDLRQLVRWGQKLVGENHINAIPNGVLSLKGGNLKNEISSVKPYFYVESQRLDEYFKYDFYKEKKLIYVQI